MPGLDINYGDQLGQTAVHWASLRGRTECVRILAETLKVEWNKRNKWGLTPLFMATQRGHFDIVDIITQQSNIDYNVKSV